MSRPSASAALYAYGSLDEAFPKADPNFTPTGSRILVQIRTPKGKSKGGIVLTEETREAEKYNSPVGKVLAVGSVAYCDRDTLKPWPEGAWCRPGQYIRIPTHGGERWSVKLNDTEALFAVVRDLDCLGLVPDPLAITAFI